MIRDWLRRASDAAWSDGWKAARAIATPWMKKELAETREKLRGEPRDHVIARDVIDRAIRDAAPPGVPFDAVVLPGRELRARFRRRARRSAAASTCVGKMR